MLLYFLEGGNNFLFHLHPLKGDFLGINHKNEQSFVSTLFLCIKLILYSCDQHSTKFQVGNFVFGSVEI